MGSSQSSSKDNQDLQNQQQSVQQQQLQQQVQQQFIPQQRMMNNKTPARSSIQSQQIVEQPYIFNDDEPIQQTEQQQQQQLNDKQIQQYDQKEKVKVDFDLQKNLLFNLKSMTKAVKLNQNESQRIPAMISIETSKEGGNVDLDKRPSLDLICVIDRSGSMSGAKIEQVRQALHCLIELLNENDRIMLIQFDHQAQRLLPFTRVSKENQEKIKKTIDSINSCGGTRIQLGMELALKGLRERKYQNPISSVFLLSDGQDSYDSVEYLKTQAISNNFIYTINSFGFGADHDPKLMNQICEVQDGNFYYVEQIDTIDEMFIDALGGLFSVIAQDVTISVKLNKDVKIFSDITVNKTYGEMWKYDEKTLTYQIKILQFIAGISKEFLMEIEIPPVNGKLQDFERNANLVSAEIQMFANKDEQKQNPIIKKANLEMTFYNFDELIPEEVALVNDDVELNYLRVRGADAIKECMQQAEQGKYQEGQVILKKMQKDINLARPQNRQKLQMLYNDLQQSEQNCNTNQYQKQGRLQMIATNKAHMEKRSRNMNVATDSTKIMQQNEQVDMYQNCLQQEMVLNRVNKKRGF